MAQTKHFTIAQWFFLIVCIGLIYLYWQVIEPFAIALVTAGIFAVVLAPIHIKMGKKIPWPKVNALILLLAVFLVVLVPLFVVSVLIVQQAAEMLDWFQNGVSWVQTLDVRSYPLFLSLPEVLQERILAIDFVSASESVVQWVFNSLGGVVSGGAKLMFNTFLFFLGLYYFLIHRTKIYQLLLDLSPFKDSLDKNIIHRIVMTMRSVVLGALIVAVIQATLATIGLTIFGVPGALLLGALVLITSQIPSIGVGIVMVPAIVYLAVTGHIPSAIGLTIWAAVVVGTIDNFLTPMILGAKTKMPEVLILVSVVGGVLAFGPIGFILGPTLLAAIMVMIDLYKHGMLE